MRLYQVRSPASQESALRSVTAPRAVQVQGGTPVYRSARMAGESSFVVGLLGGLRPIADSLIPSLTAALTTAYSAQKNAIQKTTSTAVQNIDRRVSSASNWRCIVNMSFPLLRGFKQVW